MSGTDVHDTKIQRHLAVPQSAEVRTFQKLCAQEHRLIIHNTFISHNDFVRGSSASDHVLPKKHREHLQSVQ